MTIPFKMSPLGRGKSDLPAGYLAAEFLEITGYGRTTETPYPYPHFSIPLPAIANTDDWEFSTIHTVNLSTGINQAEGHNGVPASRYYGATTAKKFYANSIVSTYDVDDKPHAFSFQQKKTQLSASFDGQEINLESSASYPPSVGVFVARATNTNYASYPFNGKKYSWRLSVNGTNVHNLIPALDSAGVPCMYDCVTKQSFYNSGTGSFIVGLTTSQARQLSKLPVTEAGTLSVSLPWEAQLVITGVPAALQAAADKGWTITVQYGDPEADNAYYNKYAACTTRADMEAVNPDYINDLTADAEWVYPLPNLESFKLSYQEKTWANGKLKKWRVPLPKLTPVPSWWLNCKTLEYMELYAPEAQYLYDPMRWCGNVTYCKIYAPKTTVIANLVTYNSKLKEIEIDTPNVTNVQGAFFRLYSLERIICTPDMFQKVTNGTDMYLCNYKLLDFPTSYPALSTAAGMFDRCQITGQQAIEILTSIPTWTDGASHPITLGIHIDYQNDTDVLTAIADAETKGWTLTVQWNGTATAAAVSTFGLRSPSIYAKLGTMEYPDGTTKPSLDWGHYVTNWTENGYQEFGSVEEAKEYFNIIDEA